MSFPFFGDEFTFTQPDGTRLPFRGWGDQHRAVFETLDGFTVVRDPVTGFYQYATLTDDTEELRPTGLRPGLTNPQTLGLRSGLRTSRAAAKAQAQLGPGLPEPRWKDRGKQAKTTLRAAMAAPGILPAPPSRQTVGDYVGLCLLIRFPDVPETISPQEVEAFCNQPGYNGFGNNGSVYDYFLDNSAGKLRYTNIVAPYYTAKHPRAYYTNPKVDYGVRTRELIKEALDYHLTQGFDFAGLTADYDDYVYAVNVFYAGDRVNNWSEGLWPHASRLLTPYPLAPGKKAYDYQITDMGSQLTLGTFCHENGHMICDFPDLYDYGYESAGTGVYCLMCAGGNADKRNPTHICAYLKYRAGWAQSVTKITAGLTGAITAGKNEFFTYEKNRAEYFIIENRYRDGRDQALTGSGLAIWHVDELGNNSNEQMTPTSHYECSLVQADGKYDLERGGNQGDEVDLFYAGGNDRFTGSTRPSSRWWDGRPSGLSIHSIGPAEPTISFSADIESTHS